MLTGIKDLDYKIFGILDDKSLINFSITNKYFYDFINNDSLWKKKSINKFGRIIAVNKIMDIKKHDITWREYYCKTLACINFYIDTGEKHISILKGRIVGSQENITENLKLLKYIESNTFRYREKYIEGSVSMENILKDDFIMPIKIYRKICFQYPLYKSKEDVLLLLKDHRMKLRKNNWRKFLIDIDSQVLDILFTIDKYNPCISVEYIWSEIISGNYNKVEIRKLIQNVSIRECLVQKYKESAVLSKDIEILLKMSD